MIQRQLSTREQTRKKRKKDILRVTEQLVLRNGIENITMNDIATEAGIGIATLFRYFPRKEKIILSLAIGKITLILEAFYEIEKQSLSCMERLIAIMDFFINKMTEEQAVLPRILDNFITYKAISNHSFDDLELYNKVRKEVTVVFFRIIEASKNDGSIRKDLQIEKIVSTIFSNFSIFTLKLSLKDNNKLIEPELSSEDQLKIMKTIFIEYLQPKN